MYMLTSGAVYCFITPDNGFTWTETVKLIPSDLQSNDYFGYAVSVYGNITVVGANYDDDSGSNSGIVNKVLIQS